MSKSERRQQQRYVVDSVNLIVGHQRFPVIDLSVGSARIATSSSIFNASDTPRYALEFMTEAKTEEFTIEAHLIRDAGIYIVIGFTPPRENWPTYIKSFDTFHVHELHENLFD